MTDHHKPRILIIGAGSMGVVVGYILSLAGAEVTFLIRPHRVSALQSPQILYCYDDNQLKEFKDYSCITDPSAMVGANYDFIYVTLDGASLRNEVGQSLVTVIGEAARGTNTKILLGSIYFGIRSWFLQTSGLSEDQVTNGYFGIHAYPTRAVTLPVPAAATLDPDLIAKADLAYTDCLGFGLQLHDNAPLVADAFSKIWNASGVSNGVVKPDLEGNLFAYPLFVVFAGCQLTGWPDFKDMDRKSEIWRLTTEAFREIQRLDYFGEIGQQAAKATTEDGLADSLVAWEKQMLPFHLQAFNRYQHGIKVNLQDRQHLKACISQGKKEGKLFPALTKLLDQIEHSE